MMKRLTIALIALCLLFSVTIHVHAAGRPDVTRTGSLTLTMEWEGEKLSGGTLTIYRVGDIVGRNGFWHFVLTPELQGMGISLEDLEDPNLARELAGLVKDLEIPGTTVEITDGKAVFTDLIGGLYLITQEDACEGFSPINPFLISLPRWENGQYIYDITAHPKVSLEPLPTEPTETEPTTPTTPTEPVLPQTGQLNWPVPVMSVAGVSLFALGWYLCFGKKNAHEA